jgi:hypothetical protein
MQRTIDVLMLVGIFAGFAWGCALFSSAAPALVPAVSEALVNLAKRAKEQTGRELEDLPFTCDTELVPKREGKPAELLMLCTVQLEE